MPILRNVWLANLVPNSIGTGVVSPTDPLGNVTTTAYDNLQRRKTLTQPDPYQSNFRPEKSGPGGVYSPERNGA